jgi:hypothetical protein
MKKDEPVKRKMILINNTTAALIHLFHRRPEFNYSAEDFMFIDEGIEPNIVEEERVAAKEFISQLCEEYTALFITELMKECYRTLKKDDEELGSNHAKDALEELNELI